MPSIQSPHRSTPLTLSHSDTLSHSTTPGDMSASLAFPSGRGQPRQRARPALLIAVPLLLDVVASNPLAFLSW